MTLPRHIVQIFLALLLASLASPVLAGTGAARITESEGAGRAIVPLTDVNSAKRLDQTGRRVPRKKYLERKCRRARLALAT